MTKPKSEFEKWFVAQHGKRRGMHALHHDSDLKEWVKAGQSADRELANRELWDEKYQSALHAWQVKK